MKQFLFRGALRYTRISCMPFRASLALQHRVQAQDVDDARRQIGLCIHRDLEQMLSSVNVQNVDSVKVETQELTVVEDGEQSVWNAPYFAADVEVPPHIVL